MIKPHVKMKFDEPTVPAETTTVQKGDKIKPSDILSLFPTQTGAPTAPPESFMDQIRVCIVAPYVYLYIYSTDFAGGTWLHVRL